MPVISRQESALSRWLRGQSPLVLALWAMVAAFTAYGCMDAFRKPFSAAAYAGSFGGMDYKTLLVLSQLAGYTISKFLGIKFVSEATPARRVAMVLGLVAVAEGGPAGLCPHPGPMECRLPLPQWPPAGHGVGFDFWVAGRPSRH